MSEISIAACCHPDPAAAGEGSHESGEGYAKVLCSITLQSRDPSPSCALAL
jgi:hypothetical protein